MSTFTRSSETAAIVSLLRGTNGSVSYDTIISYSSISAELGRPLDKLRGAISSARRILENEKIVFAVERGIGLRRLSDSEVVKSSEQMKASIRRAAHRGSRRLDAVAAPELLDNKTQLAMVTNRTIFNAIEAAATPESPKAEVVAEKPPVPRELPL